MKLLVSVPEAAMGPRGYAPVYTDYMTFTRVFAPYGLHILFGVARELYFRVGCLSPAFRKGTETRIHNAMRERYAKAAQERDARVYDEAWTAAIKWMTSATISSGLPERPVNPYRD